MDRVTVVDVTCYGGYDAVRDFAVVLGCRSVQAHFRDGGVWSDKVVVIPIERSGAVTRIVARISDIGDVAIPCLGHQSVHAGDTLTFDFGGGPMFSFITGTEKNLLGHIPSFDVEPAPELPTRRAIALGGF